jgi:type VI secretion system FHA domain protein
MWTLLLSRYGDAPGRFLDRRQIDSGQIKIGRSAETCDWAIHDENGHISREHCTISAVGLDLFVVDTSTNGVSLNDPAQRIAPHMPVAIRVRDRLILGDYVIEVATEAAGAGAALAPPPPPPLPSNNSPSPSGLNQPDQWFDSAGDSVWDIKQGNAEVHEFLGDAMHEFLGSSGPGHSFGAPPADADWGGPLSDAFSKPILSTLQPVENAFAIPADWASPGPAASPASPPVDPFASTASRGSNDPFGSPPPAMPSDPFGGPPPGMANDPFASPPPAVPNDPFADFAPPSSKDPFAGFGEPAPVARTMFEPQPPSDDGLPPSPPPPAPAAAPQAAPPPPPPASTAPAGSDAADWAAFCEGAGIEISELRRSPDAMRRLGILYRQVVLGLADLIQDRAAFKNEFRVERTQLSIGRNNPLKYLPALDTAKLLLGDPLPGYMEGGEAVRTGFEDVKKHQMAMLAGVQHALNAVFDRLSPQEIDRVMKKAAGEKRTLPFSRGVNPWTVYQAVFEALRTDSTSNVNGVISGAFREGYERFLKANS